MHPYILYPKSSSVLALVAFIPVNLLIYKTEFSFPGFVLRQSTYKLKWGNRKQCIGLFVINEKKKRVKIRRNHEHCGPSDTVKHVNITYDKIIVTNVWLICKWKLININCIWSWHRNVLLLEIDPKAFINLYKHAAILNKTIYLSMKLLLWMNGMCDIICPGFAGLCGTDSERQNQHENKCIQLDSLLSPTTFEIRSSNPIQMFKCAESFYKYLPYIKMHTRVTKYVLKSLW